MITLQFEHWLITPELLVLVVLLSLATGWALGQYWRARWIRRNRLRIKVQANEILRDAQREAKVTLAEAEVRAKELTLRESKEVKEQLEKQRTEILSREKLVQERSALLQRTEEELDKRRVKIDKEESELDQRGASLKKEKNELQKHLELLAGMTADEARNELLRDTKEILTQRAALEAKELYDSALTHARDRAREVVVNSLERVAREIISEKTVVMIDLPSEEMKGRVIGRDGRNVRAFEALTGVDVLLDEFEGGMVLSCHSPERREVAKRAMLNLIEDGRIQPSRIKQFVAAAAENLEETLAGEAQKALNQLGITKISPEIVRVLGRLYLRTSYSQNVLLHSVETASLAGIMAQELGFNVEQTEAAVRAGLLHDIGKALDEGKLESHALAGAEFLKKHGESDLVVNAVAAHHDQVEPLSVVAPLLKTADAISGARPGARREDLVAYVSRLEELEKIAQSFEGVERSYAVQAGRELQIWVESAKVSDAESELLAGKVARQIELSDAINGAVKVTVIRETRTSAVAEMQRR